MNININYEIDKGIKSKKIEAVIAKIIQTKTNKYENQIIFMLNGRKDDFNTFKNYNKRAKIIFWYSKDLIIELIKDLWNLKDIENVLNCIRDLSKVNEKIKEFNVDISNQNEYDVNHNLYFKLLTQPFYNSLTLLGITISSQILKLAFDLNEKRNISIEKLDYENKKINLEKYFENSSYNTHPLKIKEYIFTFSSEKKDKNIYTITIKNKKKGGQFGGFFIANNETITKTYFVKSYYGYPAKSNFNSIIALNSSILCKSSRDIINDSYVEPNYSQVDLKELFVYKLLEIIGLGPKVHFMINPYLKDGLFIISENLNDQNNDFNEKSKDDTEIYFYVKFYLMEYKNKVSSETDYESFNAIVDLLEIDVINRIFTLNDFNSNNFGFLEKRDTNNNSIDFKNLGLEWLKSHHNIKIIDFLPSIKEYDKYIDQKIIQDFLEGNPTTKYAKLSIMDLAISRKIEELEDEKIKKNIKKMNKLHVLKNKYIKEKLFFGKKVIESLDCRFKPGLLLILQKTKQIIM